jgi:hypothetical protein
MEINGACLWARCCKWLTFIVIKHVPNKFVQQNDALILCAMHFRRIRQIIAKMDYSLR